MAESWCRVCGKKYNVCPHCDPNNSWREICDTLSHYYVWEKVYQYRHKIISKDTAKSELSLALNRKTTGFTMEEAETFIPVVRDTIHEILDEPAKIIESSSDVKDETPVKPVVKRASNRKGRA